MFIRQSSDSLIQIKNHKSQQALSKNQKRFNSLTNKADKLRREVHEWQETIPLIQSRVTQEFMPLSENYDKHRTDYLFLLDLAYENPVFKKAEKQKLEFLIGELLEDLVIDSSSEELKDLYCKYNSNVLHKEFSSS